MSKKKILVITRNLPPLLGGMEKLNFHMILELSREFDITVIGPCQSEKIFPSYIRFIGVPLKPLWLFLTLAMVKSLFTSWRLRPDVILAGSGLTAPVAYLSSLLIGKCSAVYTHGLDVAVKNKIYTMLWLPCIRKADSIIANSNYTAKLLRDAGAESNRITIVYPGLELPRVPDDKGEKFRSEHQLHSGPILLSVGRLTTRKGLLEFVKYSLPAIVAEIPDTQLLIVGEEPVNSLVAKHQTKTEIQEAANAIGMGENIKFVGKITDPTKLSHAYYAASVHVFPVREIPNDPEGFGMVSIEAAAHGVPTAAFSTGGITDAVQHGESGFLVEKNNYPELSKQILLLIKNPMRKMEMRCFAKKFTWPSFGQGVSTALKNINSLGSTT